MLTILILLMIAWVCVGAQFVLQRRRNGRSESSVQYFRQQLSTLERATPGTTMQQMNAASGPGTATERTEPHRPQSSAKRRRRDVLFGLMGLTGFSVLARLLFSSAFTTLMLLVSLAALIAYVWALRRLHLGTLPRTGTAAPLTGPVSGIGPVTSLGSGPEPMSGPVNGNGSRSSVGGGGPVSGTVYRPSSLTN